MSSHDPAISHRKVAPASNRVFGFVLAGALAIFALVPLLHGRPIRIWVVAIAVVLFAVTFLAPNRLASLNRIWFRIGLVLHAIVNPVLMTVLFYGSVVPIGCILKLTGKDLLRLHRDIDAATYWIKRRPNSPPEGSMSKQF
jgi:hypothetical protein